MSTTTDSIHVRYHVQRQGFRSCLDLTVPYAGITAIFGPSGSGKTTLLRFIAGLENVNDAYLKVGSEIWHNRKTMMPAYQRPIAYVFQDARLFPHLTVQQNLEYGWKRTPVGQRNINFQDVIAMLELQPWLQKMPLQLSGGQAQKVALARAILCSPRLLLLDEPLASLDAEFKEEFLPQLHSIHTQCGLPMIYVSHAIDELITLADHLVLLKNGGIIANDTITQVLNDVHLPLSQLEDSCTLLRGTVQRHDTIYHLSHIQIDAGTLAVASLSKPLGAWVNVRIFARDVSISLTHNQQSSINNIFSATVRNIIPARNPSQMNVQLQLGDSLILSRITRKSCDGLKLELGKQVYAQIKTVSLMR